MTDGNFSLVKTKMGPNAAHEPHNPRSVTVTLTTQAIYWFECGSTRLLLLTIQS